MPIFAEGDAITEWLGAAQDVTGRKVAEAALRESEERLHVALASAGLGTFVWHVAEDRTEEDAQARAHFGLPPGGTISLAEALATTFHPDDGRRYAAAVARAIDPDGPGKLQEEYRIRNPDGQERWLSTTAITAFEGTPRVAVRMTGVLADVTDRKRAEAALQASEERQAFLLKLSDMLRPINDAGALRATACRMLGEHLSASRVYYVEYEPEAGYGRVADDYLSDGLPSLAGRYSFEAFRATYERISDGSAWIIPDVSDATDLPDREREYYASQGVSAWVNVPLAKNGRLEAALCTVQSASRAWTAFEISLVVEVAERLWSAVQRGRAEVALRESEARFAQFAKASAAGLWIRGAETLTMEFVSPSISAIYGVEPDALLGDAERWAALVVPEDRDTAFEHLETARRGDAVVHEFRIKRPSDGAFRWIRNTDFPLGDDGGIPRIGGIAEDVTETRRLTEHQGVLLAELQHRVRNIMGMIRSMANRTAPGAADVQDYRSLLEGRLLALARVQALLTREANAGGSLRGIIESEVAAQAHRGDQFTLTGPDIRLSPKAVEVLTLAFHELATNALKYGAFSVPDGRLLVNWTPTETRGSPWLSLDWVETGGPSSGRSTRRGFGSELIEARIPYELGGRGTLTIGPDGARCLLEFPLQDGDSILETDAPQPATIFGGALDMTGAPDLTGRTVLVVEDDYYMAHDTAAALRGAGAIVLGPCPSEETTQDLLEGETPTHAVLDLNLGGGGPRFEIARLLKSSGVPFLFLTGYDPDVIPEDMADVLRLQKPVPFRAIVEAVAQL